MSITSLQALAAQLHVFRSHPPAVSEESDLYFTDTVSTVGDETHRTLSGMHIMIGASESARLYKSLHFSGGAGIDPAKPKVSLNQLLIVCDHLELSSPLWIPECDVLIYARKLTVRPGASLKTDPQPWSKPAATDAANTGKRGQDGVDGRNAGEIAVWISEFEGPEPKKPEDAWFRAVGGKGQDPGQGKNGEDGYSIKAAGFPVTSYKISLETDMIFGKYKNSWTPTFNEHPASFFKVRYRKLEIPQPHLDETYGDSNWPTHGGHALEQGRPGEPGGAGRFVSNHAFNTDKVKRVFSTSGELGAPAKAVFGGAAGQPNTCAHHELTLWKNWGDADNLTWRRESFQVNPNAPTRPGNSYAEKRTSSAGKVVREPGMIDVANAWLHPILLQKAMIFFRDLYLAEQFDLLRERLSLYAKALAQPMPDSHERTAWDPLNKCDWQAGKIEVATLQMRLQNQLDYFGHRPGYMPVWSLQGAMKRYETQSEETLKTLLLTRWIAKESAAKKNINTAANASLAAIDKRAALVSNQVNAAEERLAEFNKQMDAMFREQNRIQKKIDDLSAQLLVKAKGNAEFEAAMKMGLKVASALCYVIPVGQPFLGAGASLATGLVENIAFSDKAGTDTAAEALSKASKEWKDAWKDYEKSGEDAEKEAKGAAKDAEDAAKRDKKDFSQQDWQKAKDAASSKASKWGTAAEGVGSALSKLSEGMAGLQIPESVIEAKLNKALAGNDEFKDLSKSLKSLLETKKQLAEDLAQGLQEVNNGYAQLATLASNAVNWHKQRAETTSVLSPMLDVFNAQLDQQARLSLVNALYEVVKAYETTVFENPKSPNRFDWKLDVIFDKIKNLLKVEQTPETLLAEAKALQPAFNKNIANVLEWLAADYARGMPRDFPLEYHLSDAKLKKLQHEPVVIDTMRKGLFDPDSVLAFLTDVELPKDGITFSSIPREGGNILIKLRASDQGIVRANGKLHSVYRESIKEWVWTYRFSGDKLTASHKTEQAEDLLKMMVKDDKLKQHLASPPAWSDLTLRVSYTGITGTKPLISKLVFSCSVASKPAPDSERTLEMRCDDPEVELKLDLPDKGGITSGKTQIFGIYRKNAEVELGTSLTRQIDWEVPEDLEVSIPKGDAWERSEGVLRKLSSGKTVRVVKARSIRVILAPTHSRIRCRTQKGWEQTK